MRPNTLKTLCWIAAACLLSGCFRPWMPPQQGYGYGGYGNAIQGGYGGYQGIQTLTPGQYYAPGTTQPTYNLNGLQPIPEGDANGTGTGSGDGGNAPLSPYNPAAPGEPVKPVPNPLYEMNGASGGLVPPETDDGTIQQNKPDLDGSSSLSAPAASSDWGAEEPIEAVNHVEQEATEEVPALLVP